MLRRHHHHMTAEHTISKTVITFTVLHRTDEPISDLRDAMERSWDGNAVGLETDQTTTPVPDSAVPDALLALNNDGTFFDFDLADA